MDFAAYMDFLSHSFIFFWFHFFYQRIYGYIRKRKANWVGHILRRTCLLKQVIEWKIKGKMEVTRRWGRRRKKLLDDLKDRRGYSHLKEVRSSRSHCVDEPFCKRLWTCRESDRILNNDDDNDDDDVYGSMFCTLFNFLNYVFLFLYLCILLLRLRILIVMCLIFCIFCYIVLCAQFVCKCVLYCCVVCTVCV
jgi:hypothetical protein